MDKSMKLGYAFEIVVTVPDLRQSLQFYEKLGYKQLTDTTSPTQHDALLTDGMILLSLRVGSAWKTILTYFAENVAEKVDGLERLGVSFDEKHETGGKITGATLTDPNGLQVDLIQAAPSRVPKPPGKPISKAGQFGELSIETEDVRKSLDFWTKLGFEPTQHMPASPDLWASIADGLLMLGILVKGHCQHIIKTPSITYFDAEAAQRIRKLKEEGMAFVQELPGENGETGHAVAQAPEGQILFLFGVN
jgi:catechol 2,3-dioxygenase-like lactoylglutathione lyase family enzyme